MSPILKTFSRTKSLSYNPSPAYEICKWIYGTPSFYQKQQIFFCDTRVYFVCLLPQIKQTYSPNIHQLFFSIYSLHQNIPSLHKLDHPNGCWNLTTTAIWDSLTKSLLIHCCDRKAGNWGGSPILDTKELMSSFNDTPIGEWTKFMEKINWFENFIWTSPSQIWNEECMDIFKKRGEFPNFQKDQFKKLFITFPPMPMPLCESLPPPLALPNWDRHTAIPWGSNLQKKNRKDGKFTWQIRRYYRHVKCSQLEENSQDMLPEFVATAFVNPVSVQGEAFSLGSLVTANDVTKLWQRLFLASWTNRSQRIAAMSTNGEPESCNTNVVFFMFPSCPRDFLEGLGTLIPDLTSCPTVCCGDSTTSSGSAPPSDQICSGMRDVWCVASTLATHFLMAWSRKTMNLTKSITIPLGWWTPKVKAILMLHIMVHI